MRRRTEYETADFLAAVRRMLRAAGRRVADGDPVDLAELVALRAELDGIIADGVAGLRAQGVTWASIGEATGTSRQAAIQKWNRRARRAS
jgi:hypothetical protein